MQFEEFMHRYGLKLNGAQCRAAQAVEGATLLLAVPGSGKTTVLVTRLGYMIIGLGIDPASILTMTYTVAATKDMKDRFCSFFGEEWRGAVEFRTINGVCARIIRAYERMTGGSAFTLVSDEKDSSAFIGSISREFMLTYPTENDIKTIRTQITYAKNMMLSDDGIRELDKSTGLPISKIYRAYCDAMREQRLMDYDDQMVYAYRILKKYPRLLQSVRNTYRYICVDEAQDTSRIQHEIIRLLAGKHGNLFMVGDEDQSIYGFRAAYPEALLSFERDHEGARVLLMEENFRSDANIVAAADRFIQKNQNRHAKKMYAARPAVNVIKEITLSSRSAQYPYLLRLAVNCKTETAVLYRENESALPLVDLLERYGVPYRVRMPDLTFFSHRLVLDICAILRLACDPYDTEAFMQIYYKIDTYLRRYQAQMLCEISRSQGVSVWDALELAEGIGGGTMKSCRSIQTHLWKMQSERADRAIERLDTMMGYGDYLMRSQIKRNKVNIMKGLAKNEPDPAHFLRRLERLPGIIRERQTDENASFILSTVHSSKGLEYGTVYLMDVVDRIFPEDPIGNPLLTKAEDMAQYEEERRLFYVAVTRAKDRLFVLTYKGEESSFGEEFLEKKSAREMDEALRKGVDLDYRAFCAQYERGMRITHKQFGSGTVLSAEGGALFVHFDDGEYRRLAMIVLYEKSLME